ncbi:hypothetical protein ACSIGC_06425 [Tenacibaculum sp. ZS6-P6]|uniref:hypothetical protein n=1 Tax=Tenacibaculum sp. ZS6-P6 TaxID=3447503 RepID=UPI003F9D1B99
MKKNAILLFIFLKSIIIFSQEEKESVFLFFDKNDKKKCAIEGESTYKNPKGKYLANKFEKKKEKKRILFNICDERFSFNRNSKIDTCDIKNLNELNIKSLEYIKNKYNKGREFKHHVFEKINIVEKISDTKIVKYYDVYWIGAWVED